ncbi:MAG: GTPase, partial [Phycisphaerae bacterium]
MFDRVDDTIVAISSPPGISARGIVRLSGPEAVSLAAQVFEHATGPGLHATPGHRRLMGRARIDADASVPAEAYVFRAPASYTRQDIVELHLPGSPPVLAMVFEELTAAGARPAEPGEFTARAYFAGALDLTEVEGVAALIHARNDSQLRASEALLHGRLSQRSSALREELTDLLALLEAEIDFVEESIEFTTSGHAIAILDKVAGELDALLRDAPAIERLEVLPRILLVGRPNAGKSTLFNRLSGLDRAIASATAGTTRDVLTAPMKVPGGEVMLLDSAGVECGPQTASQPSDPTPGEAAGSAEPAALAAAATRRSVGIADLVLMVVDVTDAPLETIRSLRSMLPRQRVLIVLNKVDAIISNPPLLHLPDPAVRVSALTG